MSESKLDWLLDALLAGCASDRDSYVPKKPCFELYKRAGYMLVCAHRGKADCLEARRAALISAVKEEIGDWERVARILAGLASGLPGWSDKHRQEVLDWAKVEVAKCDPELKLMEVE